MSSNEPKDSIKNPKLIDRRFFLKSSSAVVAAASVGAIPLLIKEEPTKTISGIANDTQQTTKQWKAGWMAF